MSTPTVQYFIDDQALSAKGASISTTAPMDASYPVTNLLNPDRKVIARTAASPAATVDFDLVLATTYTALGGMYGGAGVFNLATDAPEGSKPWVEVFVKSSAGGTFATTGVILDFASMTLEGPDKVGKFVGLYPYAYWRFRVTTNGYRFSIGHVMVAGLVELPYLYSPGSEYRGDRPEPDAGMGDIDGAPVQIIIGRRRRLYMHQFTEVEDDHRIELERVDVQDYPIGLLDSCGRSNHALVSKTARLRCSHQFGLGEGAVWNASIGFEQLV